MTRFRSVPRHRHFSRAITTAIAAALLAPATVPAATTVGQTAPSPADTFNCGGPSLFVQRTVAAPPDYVIPAGGGVITSWSVMGQAGGQLRLKVVRRTAPNTYTIVAEDTVRPIAPLVLNTFNTRIAVTGGELLALWVPSGEGQPPPCTFTPTDPGDAQEFRMGTINPEPGIGQTFQTNTVEAAHRINVSASVEPDCDSDGFGDETQDPDTSSCNPREPVAAKANRTLTLDANKGKVKKGRKVRLTGQIDAPGNEAACELDQTVELQRKKKKAPDTAFSTFRSVQTEQTGNFAQKVKVKKTRIYRAQVQETEACEDDLSNTKKVRVKKPKAAKEA